MNICGSEVGCGGEARQKAREMSGSRGESRRKRIVLLLRRYLLLTICRAVCARVCVSCLAFSVHKSFSFLITTIAARSPRVSLCAIYLARVTRLNLFSAESRDARPLLLLLLPPFRTCNPTEINSIMAYVRCLSPPTWGRAEGRGWEGTGRIYLRAVSSSDLTDERQEERTYTPRRIL